MRRARGYAVGAAGLGAGVALLAVSRPWGPVTTSAPSPTGVVTTTGATGTALYPWVTALALAALAGAGALLATRGAARLVVGGLLVLAAAGIVAGGGYAVVAEPSPTWPAIAVAGGIAVADAGWLVLRRGRDWPALGARFDARPAGPAGQAGPAGPAGNAPRAGGSRAMWEALDRGDDPTR